METLLRGSKERADIKIKDELSDVILDWACPNRKNPWDHKSWYIGIGHPNSDRTFLRTLLPLVSSSYLIGIFVQFPLRMSQPGFSIPMRNTCP